MFNEKNVAHLGFIQGVINRMGNNSFLIKSWAVTLVAAIFALSAQDASKNFVYLALFPLIFFWWLDAFFLHQEKLYRILYEKVAKDISLSEHVSMNAYLYEDEVESIFKVIFSNTLTFFYLPILAMIPILWIVFDFIKSTYPGIQI